ncbi:tetratricopeptide repeat protein [bacterium]|nr:tetratricopeptide repeat protein [bacterium]MBU1636083.1 tetratricopeptide repeat protein [bacterium]MBU1919209.1 tetratricopeptide repeat protein [bacterium]
MAKAIRAKGAGKLTKKELREDKLVGYASKVERFYHENQNRVLGIVVVLVILIAGGIFLQRMSSESRMIESYDLTIAKMAFGQEQYDAARVGLEKVISEYSGEVAAEAKYYLSRIDFEQGKYTEAEAGFREYQQSFSGDDNTNCAAVAGLAASLEAQKKFEEAAATFEEAVQRFPKLAFAPEALVQAARIYMYINQNDNAARVLAELIEKYPDSNSAAKAKQDLDQLQ